MNHKERFLAALELEEPDCVPITDMALDPPIVSAILNREASSRPKEFGEGMLSFTGGSASQESSADYRMAMVKACQKLDFDAVVALSDYSLVSKSYRPKLLDKKTLIDQWGRVMQASVEGKTTYFVGGTVSTAEDLDTYEPPDAFDPDIVQASESLVKSIRDEDIAISAQVHSGWHFAFQVRGGIDKLVVDFYRNPSFARRLISKIARACENFAKVFVEAGADVLLVTDDYADNHGPLISPRIFREFELQNLKNIVDVGRKHGIPVIKHSDGNLYPILEDIIDTGISGLHPIEPGAMDLADVKDRYGERICLMGNVDCRYVLPFGSEEDVRKDVRRCIDAAGDGGGFVLASSNSLHANVKIANIWTMVDEARKYGKYPLRAH